MELKDLLHVSRPLESGGEIVVLNTGALIGPEAQAMLGALYSRSSKGIRKHLGVLVEKGHEQFMDTYYIGYGHKSIGDLGTAAVFIDGVSMLGAKAIQEFPLYNGQESSTRYIDFSNQLFLDPIGSPESKAILEAWRQFHIAGFDDVIPSLKERFPRKEEEGEKEYEKAIKSRAFDIMRGFLPVGATTNVAWMGELRQFADRLPELRNSALPEICEVGTELESALVEAFPHSFSGKHYERTERYYADFRWQYYRSPLGFPDFELTRNDIRAAHIGKEYELALAERPEKVELPWSIRECGQMQFRFLLDFGSYRDLQRQRALIVPVPLVSADYGFEEWYLAELPERRRTQGRRLIERQLRAIGNLECSREMRQYYFPMGMRCPIRMTGDLRGLVYFVELRVDPNVHPTLCRRAMQVAGVLERELGNAGLVLHLHPEPGRFDVKRGTHDIIEKV